MLHENSWKIHTLTLLALCTGILSKAQDSCKHGYLYNRLIAAHPTDTVSESNAVFLVPVLGHTPEGGYEYGSAVFRNFCLPTNHGKRNSFFTAKGSVTSLGSVNLIGYGECWSKQDRLFMDLDVRNQDFPFYFYGIGNNTHLSDKTLAKERLSHISFEAAKSWFPHYYIGGNLLLENQRYSTPLRRHRTAVPPR